MCNVNIYELKTNLSKFIEMIEKGEEKEIVIYRYDKKVAVIHPYEEKKNTKRLGAGVGLIEVKPFSLKEDREEVGKLFGY